MPSYTKVHLIDDVQDMAPRFGYAPDMESRFARTNLELQESGMSHFRLAAGFRVPFGHVHHTQEEVYLVLKGSARIKLDDEVVEVGELEALRIAPGVTRGMEAGPAGAEILAFGAPNTDNQDAEMIPGWWED
jgi:mannose-6-phosphate isomerase-like protein (cupin superfamily)